jgi:hypothetical protein
LTRYTIAVAQNLEAAAPVHFVTVAGETVLMPREGARATVPLVVMGPDGRPTFVVAAGLWRWCVETELLANYGEDL